MTNGRKKKKAVEKEDVMTYADMFSKVKGMFMNADVSDIHEHLAYQFNITGEAEGIFYVEVKEGKLYVEPYEYFDRDAMFICSAETLFKIAEGKADPILAFTLGKLKVEGNIDKALRLKELIDSKKQGKKDE
jgi:putative sterol carrier protein